jgi:hypothetical protein
MILGGIDFYLQTIQINHPAGRSGQENSCQNKQEQLVFPGKFRRIGW